MYTGFSLVTPKPRPY